MAQWIRKGIYHKSSTINGRETWTSEFNAIWYAPEYWMIGPLNNIGTNIGGMYSIYANTCPFYIQSEKWLYSDSNRWTSAATNEINIYCLNGIYMTFIEIMTELFDGTFRGIILAVHHLQLYSIANS